LSFCGSAFAGIGMAVLGYGYWSLVGMAVSAPLVSTLGAWLGLYGRAYQLINLPTELLNSSITTVVVPALSRLQQDTQRLRRTFLTCYSFVLSLTIPGTLICAVFAEEIISVVLGGKWARQLRSSALCHRRFWHLP
jgi:O-antigen/teichoic acid export membrane protein